MRHAVRAEWLVEIMCRHKTVSIGHRTQPVDRLSEHWSIDRGRWTPVLAGSHHVRELVSQRILAVEVGTIQRNCSLRLGHCAAAAKVFGPNR